MNNVNPQTYFEEIGAWPASHRTGSMLRSYVLGFVGSLVLTIAAYLIALHIEHTNGILIALGVLALTQFILQLVCFLHLSTDKGSRARVLALTGASIVVFVLISGSIWIMFNLNSRMMPGIQQMNDYMSDQYGGI